MSERCFSRLLLLLGALAGNWVAPLTFGESHPDWESWRGVNHVRGVATVEMYSWAHDEGLPINETNETRRTNTFHFVVGPKEFQPGSRIPLSLAPLVRSQTKALMWESIEALVTGNFVVNDVYNNSGNRGTISDTSAYRGSFEDPSGVQFIVDLNKGTWEFHTPVELRDSYTVTYHRVGQTRNGGVWTDDNLDGTSQETSCHDGVFFFDVPLSGKAGFLSAHAVRDFTNENHPTSGSRRTMNVRLWPEFDDVTLEVTVDGYADWRPLGSLKSPQTAGSRLPVKATLKPKDTAHGVLPPPKHFTFKLVETSREPGVCLNWPLGAQDHDPDLKVAANGQFPGTVDAEGQSLETTQFATDPEGNFYSASTIESFDFGGRATLEVTCELEDGRTIVGLFKSPEGDLPSVLLPKRAHPSDWIADSWKQSNQAGDLPDDDDSENDPVGDHHKGDGFTLYEEYRGWVVAGQHLEGDPKKKDFFILNQRGADARGGIALFERVSGLKVRSRVRDGLEMSRERRCLNANHRDAPHRVDQFGVIIANDSGAAGGLTAGIEGTDPKKAFRPHLVNLIYLESSAAGHGQGIFSVGSGANAGLSARDADSAWDRGVAHELLHTVGVDHHGDKVRWKRTCYFQGPAAPGNPTKQPRYTSEPHAFLWQISRLTQPFPNDDWYKKRGDTIVLQWEDTRKDVFDDQLALYESEYQLWHARFASADWSTSMAADAGRAGTTPEFMIDFQADAMASSSLSRNVWVGPQNGTDSGDDFCIMRYYFATGFEIAGAKNSYYFIRPGSTHAGRQLCTSAAGSGNNEASRDPQSRFGDAAAGRGDCAGQICPNDAIPPRNLQ